MKKFRNHSLKDFNSFHVDARCSRLVVLESLEDVSELVTEPQFIDSQHFVLGGGSNVLFKGDYDGCIVQNSLKGIEQVATNANSFLVKAKAGEDWQDLVNYCIKNNLGGIENLSYIPGTVGAAPIQNIGAYGVELKDVFHSLTAVNIADGEDASFDLEECKFGYRTSIFKEELRGKYIITSVQLRLSKDSIPVLDYGDVKARLTEHYSEPYSLEEISKTIGEIRSSKLPDPKVIGNAGSFFQEPNYIKRRTPTPAISVSGQPKLSSRRTRERQNPSRMANRTVWLEG